MVLSKEPMKYYKNISFFEMKLNQYIIILFICYLTAHGTVFSSLRWQKKEVQIRKKGVSKGWNQLYLSFHPYKLTLYVRFAYYNLFVLIINKTNLITNLISGHTHTVLSCLKWKFLSKLHGLCAQRMQQLVIQVRIILLLSLITYIII